MTRWLEDEKKIDRIRLPRGAIARWFKRASDLMADGDNSRMENVICARKQSVRITGAIQRLLDHQYTKGLRFLDTGQGEEPYHDGQMMVEVLHPSYMFMEAEGKLQANEASVVLRLSYGRFAALLLGDLDSRGLRECLRLEPDQLRAQVVKIPHHGAWPQRNAIDLENLLSRIRPELAVLSVGSTNIHKHVAPQLFAALLRRRAESALRFMCTEVTRTCFYSANERQAMGSRALQARMPCAGDITVIAEGSGCWRCETETDHSTVIRSLRYAACDGRADLDG